MLGAFWSSPFSSLALDMAVFEVVGVAGVDLLLCVGTLGWRGTAGTSEVLPWAMHSSVPSKRKPLSLLILMDEARNPIVLESQFPVDHSHAGHTGKVFCSMPGS